MEAEWGHFLQDLARSGTVSSTTSPLVVGEAAWGTESVLGPTSAYWGMVTERRGPSTLRSGTPSPMGPWRFSRLKRLEGKEDTFILQVAV
ncbi:hypothetical protein J4Q44_G00088510 [Coregonus suidteri]|uniref:Uncharacterized protein n=1 Tax=Coregonus suidteri TaxID=861788 RepID=A0AAN8QYB0_9TELE